jgi:predicted nuclease of predicted toxin-antitoxin system
VTFVADESLDRQIVEAVRGLGYEVLSIAESAAGITDDDVLSRANAAQSVLLTADKDFGELLFRQHRAHAGVVLLRLAGLPPNVKAQIAAAAYPHTPLNLRTDSASSRIRQFA